MIMERRDAKLEIRLTDGDEDVLNEVPFSPVVIASASFWSYR